MMPFSQRGWSLLMIATLPVAIWGSAKAAGAADPPPNIVVILADDLGFSDLGCYGGEIETPHLDRLARGGLRCSQFYNTGRCWPTRASLLTGYYAQAVRRDTVPGVTSGGRGVRPDWAPLITSPLAAAGYRCYHSGKWHLDGMPLETGFDASYYLRDQGRFFSPQTHFRNDRPLPAIERDSGFYATEAIGTAAVEDLRSHAETHVDAPFFLYLAFTAPHFPLHAPQELIDHYRDTYTVGWDDVRASRWRRIEREGYLAGELSAVMRDVGPPYAFPDAISQLGPGEINRPVPWDELSQQQQRFQATKMAIHAAMIHALDQQVGRVLDQIEAMGERDNTLVVFLSDNGASAEIMVRSDGHDPSAAMGSAASYLCLGPGWSTVSNTPLRYHKTWVHEGGIATPAIVHWPTGIDAPDRWIDTPLHVIDLFPTLLDIAGVADQNDDPTATAPPRPGVSFAPLLRSAKNSLPTRSLYWHHEGNRAVRSGDWKLVARADGPWELYDLAVDRSETHDLAETQPGRVRQLAELWQQLHQHQIALATQTDPAADASP